MRKSGFAGCSFGVATALIGRLGEIAAERGAWVMFVQADPPDAPAIALYDKLGTRDRTRAVLKAITLRII